MFTPMTSVTHSLPIQSVGKVSNFHSVNLEQAATTSVLHTQRPYVEVIEQPAAVGARFRYKCEGRSAGCIRGASSTEKRKTYPTIKVCGYQGTAVVVVSCVTKDGPPYYPHPHNLVGKHTCRNGVCSMVINSPEMICSFPNLGIQCVKKKDIKDSLLNREALKVDPFGTGFSHHLQPNKINLNSLRLCFQVFIKDSNGTFTQPLTPVVSDPIFDNKTVSDLTISKLSHCSAPVTGGQEIILLCDQVNKDDIQIVLYEERNGQVIWEAQGRFSPHHVHRKAAICFISPPYRNMNIQHVVEGFIQLRRPSDGAFGKPRSFHFIPLKRDPEGLLRKKHKFENLRADRLLQYNASSGGSATAENVTVPRMIKHAVRIKDKSDHNFEETFQKTFPSCSKFGQQQTLENSDSFAFSGRSEVTGMNSVLHRTNTEPRPISIPFTNSSLVTTTASVTVSSCSSRQIGGSSIQDILAIAAKQIGMNTSPELILPISHQAVGESTTDETLEKLDSLDLGFDPSELDVNDMHLSDMNFDSGPDAVTLNFSSGAMDTKFSLDFFKSNERGNCT